MLEKLKQKSTWLGLLSVALPLLQIAGIEFDVATQDAIASTLAFVVGIVLIWVNPK